MNIIDKFRLDKKNALVTGCKRGIGKAMMTMAFANEWAGKGVQVNAIAPGYIATDNTKNLRNNPERAKAILARIPAGRWGNRKILKGPLCTFVLPHQIIGMERL